MAANQIARLHAMHTMPALNGRPSRSLRLCVSFRVSMTVCRSSKRRAGLRESQPQYDGACFCLLRRSQDSSACQMPQADSYVLAEPDTGPQQGCRPEGRASRRALLAESALIGCLAAACSNPSIAAAAGVTPGQAAAALRGANVVPALPPSGYLRLIAVSRPTVERTVAAQVPILLCHPCAILLADTSELTDSRESGLRTLIRVHDPTCPCCSSIASYPHMHLPP